MSLKRLEEQYENYQTMDETLPEITQEAIAESVVQRFETCYDSLWKALRRHLQQELGIPEVPTGPKPIFRTANENGLLASPIEQWIDYVDARIGTAHDYSGEKAEQALGLIQDFIDDAIGLYQTMSGETWA